MRLFGLPHIILSIWEIILNTSSKDLLSTNSDSEASTCPEQSFLYLHFWCIYHIYITFFAAGLCYLRIWLWCKQTLNIINSWSWRILFNIIWEFGNSRKFPVFWPSKSIPYWNTTHPNLTLFPMGPPCGLTTWPLSRIHGSLDARHLWQLLASWHCSSDLRTKRETWDVDPKVPGSAGMDQWWSDHY